MSNLILKGWARDPRLPQLQFKLKGGPWYLRGSYLPPGPDVKTRKWFEKSLGSREFNVNGKGHYLAPQDVLQEATIQLGRVYGRPVEAGAEHTVGFFVKKFLAHQETAFPKTYVRDKYAAKHLEAADWLWSFHIIRLTDREWDRYVGESPGRKLYNERRVLRGAIREALRVPAVAAQWPEVPRLRLKKWHTESDVGREVAAEEFQTLLNHLKKQDAVTYRYYRIMVPLALETGFRHDECCSLERSHLDLPARRIRFGLGETKDGASRDVEISQDLARTLARHLLTHASEWVFPMPTDASRPIRRDNSTWPRALEGAKVSFRFHDIRHTVASRLIRAGFPPSSVGKRLGMGAKTLHRIYEHLDAETKAAMAAELRKQYEGLYAATWEIGE